MKTISDVTRGIWVGFAAFYDRGETETAPILHIFEELWKVEEAEEDPAASHPLAPFWQPHSYRGADGRSSRYSVKLWGQNNRAGVKLCARRDDSPRRLHEGPGERPAPATGLSKGGLENKPLLMINAGDFAGGSVPSVFRCFRKSQPKQYASQNTEMQSASCKRRWDLKSLD